VILAVITLILGVIRVVRAIKAIRVIVYGPTHIFYAVISCTPPITHSMRLSAARYPFSNVSL
jgi:hypothetical protein